MTAQSPRISAILQIFEPTTLPRLMSALPAMAASTLTTSSGALVAKGDEREPDDQRGDAASLRDAHAAAHEKFRAVIEGGDAGGAVEQVQNRLHETPPGSVSCFSGIWKNSPFL